MLIKVLAERKHQFDFSPLSPNLLFATCLLASLLALALPVKAADKALSETAGFGPKPTLPEPSSSLIPTVNIAPEKGWSKGEKPIAAPGLTVTAYATGLTHPRTLHVLPNGDVLVTETNAPERHDEQDKSIKGWAMKITMKAAGAAVPSPDRITLLRGVDENGAAKSRSVFLEQLHSPFGMALIGNDFYVANTDAVVRFPYRPDATTIASPGIKITDLPAGKINHHWTKDLIASHDGKHLYATVGSNSNVAENGMENEVDRAAILEIDLVTGRYRVFASGLRNPNGLAWQPQSGALWVAVNERDEIGNDLVPDYMTAVHDGGFYGWPYSYYGQHVDVRVKPQKPELVASAITPDYALGAHTASLGLTFYTGNLLGAEYAGGAFVGQHGSWNRKPRSGYKVIFVPFKDGIPAGPPKDILTGFVNEDGKALGRPVGVAVDKTGALLVADDVGNTVWRITPAK